MDIANIKPTDRTVEITDPRNGQPLGIRCRVVSIEDDRLKAVKRRITNDTLALQSKNKALKADELESNGHTLLFTACLGWDWYNPTGSEGDKNYNADAMPTFEGEVPDFNQRNFKRVITALPWIADQLREEIDETKAFFAN